MKTSNRVLFTAILGIWIFLSDPIASSQSVSSPKIPLPTKQEEDSTPPITGTPGGHPSVQETPTPPIPGTAGGSTGVRGRGGFCSIAPATLGQTPTTIWHDLPMFVWDGSVSKVEVRPHNSDKVLWSIELEATVSFVQYDGAPLQPGQTYDVIITTTGQTILSFQVMDAQARDQIAAELRELEARAQEQGADAESIAFTRAQYFAKLGLRSDALQEAFSVIEPGEDPIAIAALLTCDLGN